MHPYDTRPARPGLQRQGQATPKAPGRGHLRITRQLTDHRLPRETRQHRKTLSHKNVQVSEQGQVVLQVLSEAKAGVQYK